MGFLGKVGQKLKALVVGEWGESVAADFLVKKGYKILGRRVRFGPRAELDLVARDGEILVFVEVKTRGDEYFGRPASSVNAKKRRALSRAAVRYIKRLRTPRIYFRFDIVEVVGDPDHGSSVLRHIENAFTLSAPYRV